MSYQVADLHNFVTHHIITHSWSFTNLFHKNNIFKSKAPLLEISEICNTWGVMDHLTISSECCLCTLRFKNLLIFHLNTLHYLFKWIIQFCTCKCQGTGVHLSAGVLTGDKHQLPWNWTYRWAWATHRDTKHGSSADQYALFTAELPLSHHLWAGWLSKLPSQAPGIFRGGRSYSCSIYSSGSTPWVQNLLLIFFTLVNTNESCSTEPVFPEAHTRRMGTASMVQLGSLGNQLGSQYDRPF